MENEQYMKMLNTFNQSYDNKNKLLIEWKNGLKIKCSSLTGMYETDTEFCDEDYIGEFAAGVNEIVILENGRDNSVEMYDGSIEISLINIPEKITSEDGTLLWQR